jgi:hypothetical protein
VSISLPSHSRKQILAGGLAGLSSVLLLMIASTLLLTSGVFWQYAFNSGIPGLQEAAGAAMRQDINQIPLFLWAWRWILLGFVLIGVVLAAIDLWSRKLPPLWQKSLLAPPIFLIVGTIIITGMLLSAEASLFDGRDQAARLASLAARRASIWGQLLFGLVVALALAGVVWLSWSWWYTRWQNWLKLPRYTPEPSVLTPTGERKGDAWFERRSMAAKAERIVIGALIGALLILFGLVSLYGGARTSVLSGEFWVESDQANPALALELTRSQGRVFVESALGEGHVDLQVLSRAGQELGLGSKQLAFQSSPLSFDRTEFELSALERGSYLLQTQLLDGKGGRLGYAIMQQDPGYLRLMALLLALVTSAIPALLVVFVSLRQSR